MGDGIRFDGNNSTPVEPGFPHDMETLRDFYRSHVAEVHAVCLRIIRDQQEAEDVVSEVFFELWKKRDRFDAARSTPRTYLLLMARSRAIDRYRSRQRTGVATTSLSHSTDEPVDLGSSPDDGLIRTEAQIVARHVLGELDDVKRQVLELVFYEGMSHPEIAEHLGMPLGTVKSHIRRGLVKMREFAEAAGARGSNYEV